MGSCPTGSGATIKENVMKASGGSGSLDQRHHASKQNESSWQHVYFLFLQIEGHVYSLRFEELKQMALQECKQKLNLFRAQSSKFQLSKLFNYFLYIICIQRTMAFLNTMLNSRSSIIPVHGSCSSPSSDPRQVLSQWRCAAIALSKSINNFKSRQGSANGISS